MFICISPLPSSLESIRIFLRGREKEKNNTGKSIDPIDQITKDCTIGRGNRGRERRGECGVWAVDYSCPYFDCELKC